MASESPAVLSTGKSRGVVLLVLSITSLALSVFGTQFIYFPLIDSIGYVLPSNVSNLFFDQIEVFGDTGLLLAALALCFAVVFSIYRIVRPGSKRPIAQFFEYLIVLSPLLTMALYLSSITIAYLFVDAQLAWIVAFVAGIA